MQLASSIVPGATGNAAVTYIPLRAQPNVADASDAQRVELVRQRWSSQDALLAQRDRQIEENVRMLAGRQWEVFSPQLGRFVDISIYMSEKERAFRQRPVVNRLLYWFMLTHARLTENPPVVSFQPSTADRKDSLLAEVMDVVFKTLWQQAGMLEVIDRMMTWLIPAGTAYLKSRIDFQGGSEVQLPQTGYDQNGVLAVLGMQSTREGELVVDVLSPLEVRGEWNAKPWHQKSWHIHRSYLTPREVKERWGVDVTPESTGLDATGVNGYLARLMFSNGAYGAAENQDALLGTTMPPAGPREDGYCIVDEMWERDCGIPGFEMKQGKAGGRLTVIMPNQNKVLWDSNRPFALRGASTIREFRFVSLPGRPSGTSPQEMLNPIQRAYNRGWAQLLEHRALMTNPIIELDANSGLESTDFVARPGAVIPVHKRPGVEAFRFVAPPQISGDVWRVQQQLSDVLDVLGNIPGATGAAPTQDASGNLVQELRFNSDRFVGPTSKRTVLELARMVDDWQVMIPVMWPAQKIMTYAGEDNIARTMTVLPEMWEGKVHVIADVESMLPEGRGERQKRVQELYAMGAFGQPGAPGAIKAFLELSRFPHLSRTIRPGGVHRVTAEQFLGHMIQGSAADELPLLEWYDYEWHKTVFEEFMASPEYLRQTPEVQHQLDIRRKMILLSKQEQQMREAAEMAHAALLAGAVHGTAQRGVLATAPQPPAAPNTSTSQE